MRRRLTVTMLVLVAATVLVTSAATFILVRRAALSTAETQLSGQARSVSSTIADGALASRVSFADELDIIGRASDFSAIRMVELSPSGTVSGTLPSGLTAADLDVAALEDDRQVVGSTGRRLSPFSTLAVYSAVPTPIPGFTGGTPVLVAVRQVHDPASGVGYFAVVALIALAVAAAAAARLAGRFSRPVVAAVDATRRIAAGDLDATVPVEPGDVTELRALAGSINSMAADLARSRDHERQFLLSVSHELRTPLTSIRGYADAVLDGTAGDTAAALRVIDEEARRLERLVQDLLDLARLDAGRFTVVPAPVEAGTVVRQAADGLRPEAAAGHIVLSVTVPPDPVWVTADPDRLAQVVTNLVANALSFASGAVAVGVRTGPADVTVEVGDDGPGIAPGDLDRVFERHYTSDRPGTVRRVGGTGLGLAIVAELVAAMGGTVAVASPTGDGRGTLFSVHLRPGPPGAAQVSGSTASSAS